MLKWYQIIDTMKYPSSFDNNNFFSAMVIRRDQS